MNEEKNICFDKSMKMEIHKCALCFDAPCSKIYKNIHERKKI